MARVLVTGGAGFIGSHLVRALLALGHEIRVLDNFSTGSIDNLENFQHRIELVDTDVRKLEKVQMAAKGVEVVFHLAALGSVARSLKDPVATTQVNVMGTLNVLEAARQAKVRRLVFASSSSVYGEQPDLVRREGMKAQPESSYALSKWMGERYCALYHRLYGLQTVVLRYFNVFGPHQDPSSLYAAVVPRFIQALLSGKSPVIYGDGEQSRDFTYVENAVSANLLASQVPTAVGGIFNVGCGRSISVNALLKILAQLLDTEASPRFEPARRAEVRHSQADIAWASERLGYLPVVEVEEGLRRTAAWHQEKEAARHGTRGLASALPLHR